MITPPPAAALPEAVKAYRRTSEFNEQTVPTALLSAHNTKAGVWGRIHVLEGELLYRITDPRRTAWETVLTPTAPPGIVEPTIAHEVQPLGPVRFFVEFYR